MHQFELDEIKVTTQALTHEIGSMRKMIEDLHISASEKEAEIIRLKMHLGDEKAKSRMRQSSTNLHKDTGSASKPTRPQDQKQETPRGKQSLAEMQRSHQQEIKHLQDKLKE